MHKFYYFGHPSGMYVFFAWGKKRKKEGGVRGKGGEERKAVRGARRRGL